MQITRVGLEDFGPHKKINVKTASNLVGLLGPNGSGKSNFLEAIKLGLSSTTTDNLESYIRDGAESAIIDIDFAKAGGSGKIYRKIGKGPKRVLEWDGQKYTKAEEIEKVLKDLLGADKHVLANAVFVSQGDLDKLLFGVQSEREELFIKMMCLNYMAQVADIANTRADKLASTIRDFTVLLDEIRHQQDAAETTRADIEAALEKLPDVSDDLDKVTNALECNKRALECKADCTLLNQEISSKEHVLARGLSAIQIEKFKTVAAFKEWLDAKNQEVVILTQELATHADGKLLKDRLGSIMENISQLETDLKALEADPSIPVPTYKEVQKQEAVVEDIKYRIRLEKEIHKSFQSIKDYKSQIKELDNTCLGMEAELAKVCANLEDKRKKYSFNKLRIDTLAAAIKSARSGDSCESCPLCESTMVFSVNEMIDKQDALRQINQAITLEADELVASKEDMEDQLKNKQAAITYAKSMIKRDEEMIAEKTEAINELRVGDLEQEDAHLNSIRTSYDKEKSRKEKHAAITSQYSRELSKLKSMPQEDKMKALTYSEEAHVKCTAKLNLMLDVLPDLKEEYDRLSKLQTEIDEKDKQLAGMVAKRDILYQAVHDPVLTPLFNRYQRHASPDLVTFMRDIQAELQTKQEARQNYIGQLEQANKTATAALKRFSELEIQAQAETIKRKVVGDLKRIKLAFSRQGIPNMYINHMYKRIIEVAQVHLSEMEANFSIRAHATKAVSFQFVRNDNSSGTYFEQNKLSGGQRVRLTIAVLLAIQQILVPDLGLLVLDEPSMHVEETGVCALRDLFMTMGSRMANNESQIWISDHNDILATAFGTTIQFT